MAASLRLEAAENGLRKNDSIIIAGVNKIKGFEIFISNYHIVNIF